MTLRILEAGTFTTVQDLGRPGRGAFGVPPSGGFDALALRAANLLVGNPQDAATLECTLNGPVLASDRDLVVSLAGAACDTRAGDTPIELGTSFVLRARHALRVGRAISGVRCYLAVRGGIDAPIVLGSRATHVAAGIGGIGGRPLAAGDLLDVGADPGDQPKRRRLSATALPELAGEIVLRAIPGPQEEAFTLAGRRGFFSAVYRVSPHSDRSGVRLEGEAVELASTPDLDPEGTVEGAVQVPGDGMPIVLGPDRPTTGGYAKIATVVTADMSLVAQARPGTALRFKSVTIAEARMAWRRREAALLEGIEELG